MKRVLSIILIIITLFTASTALNVSAALSTSYYEGENCTSKSSDCVVGTSNYPYIGTGYIDMGGSSSYVEWNNINCATAGNHTLLIKYANNTGNRPCELKVNGTVVKTLNFPSHFSDWSYYWMARVVVNLNAGNNTIRLTATTSSGGPNIDNIAISGDEGVCSPQGTIFDVKSYGAKGDGSTNDTEAIQAAINACTSGGSVVLTGGTFMSGQIKLKSNMTLWISEGATLKGIQDNSLYPAIAKHSDNANIWKDNTSGGGGFELKEAFVYAEGCTNLNIAGGGTINGNGDCSIWKGVDETLRPTLVYIGYSSNVKLANLDLIDSAMWTCPLVSNDGVIVDGINITATTYAQNKDGIDICDSHDVTITNSTVLSEDDAICPKSGSTKGVDNLNVKNVTINSSSAAGNFIKFGTMTYGSFTNSTFQDMTVNGTGIAGIAIESVDGADVSNITFKNIKMKKPSCPIFIINGAGVRDHRPAGASGKIGSINGVTFTNIECKGSSKYGAIISGTIRDGVTYRVQNLTFSNVNLTNLSGGQTSVPSEPAEYSGQYPEPGMWNKQVMPAWGYYIRHANTVTFTSCTQTVASTDARQATVKTDVQ